MTAVATTYTFVANTTANSGEVNQNFTDLVNYINNLNAGTTTWDAVYATSATNNPVLKINNSTGTNAIASFQDNGTAVLSIVDGGTTTVTATAGGSGNALVVNNSTSTGNIIDFQDNGSSILVIADGGTMDFDGVLFRHQLSSSGNTLEHRILNSANAASSQALFSAEVGGSSSGDAYALFAVTGTSNYAIGLDNSDSDKFVMSVNTTLGTNNFLTATSAREVSLPGQPCFLAMMDGATNVTGDGTAYTVAYDTEVFDQNADYNNGTFTFTAPVTGRYHLTAAVGITGWGASHTYALLAIVTTARSYAHTTENIGGQGDGNGKSLIVDCIADMTAADTATVSLTVAGSTLTVDLLTNNQYNYFSGELVA